MISDNDINYLDSILAEAKEQYNSTIDCISKFKAERLDSFSIDDFEKLEGTFEALDLAYHFIKLDRIVKRNAKSDRKFLDNYNNIPFKDTEMISYLPRYSDLSEIDISDEIQCMLVATVKEDFILNDQMKKFLIDADGQGGKHFRIVLLINDIDFLMGEVRYMPETESKEVILNKYTFTSQSTEYNLVTISDAIIYPRDKSNEKLKTYLNKINLIQGGNYE